MTTKRAAAPRSMNADQAGVYFAECAQLLSNLKPAEVSLRARAFDPGLGFPRSSMGGLGGPTGEADPVGELAVHGGTHELDPVRDAQREIWRTIHAVRAQLSDAWNLYARTTRGLPELPEPTAIDDLWCTSCKRAGVLEPRGSEKEVGRHSVHCGWCHTWLRDHGSLPPIELLQRKATGERITNRVLAEVQRSIQRAESAAEDAAAAKKKRAS